MELHIARADPILLAFTAIASVTLVLLGDAEAPIICSSDSCNRIESSELMALDKDHAHLALMPCGPHKHDDHGAIP